MSHLEESSPPVAEIGYSLDYDHLYGRRVRVKAGAPVHSMHPKQPTWSRTKRAQVVTVEHVLCGHNDFDDVPVRDPQVRWPGAGGYWRGVPVQWIEEIA